MSRCAIPLLPLSFWGAVLVVLAGAAANGANGRSQAARASRENRAAAPPQTAATPLPSGAPFGARDLDAEARAPAQDVRVAPSSRGVLGAWLLAGPFRAAQPIDEAALTPSLGGVVGGERDLAGKRRPPAKWILGSAGPPTAGGAAPNDVGPNEDRPIDLKALLEATMPEVIGYAAGKLHVERPGSYLLLLGVDDGVKVNVDGRVVFTRDEPRMLREDDDIIALDLAAGDHDVLLKFHQRDANWGFRARFVDATLAASPGAYLTLPGTTADDAKALAAKMSAISLDRVFDATSTPSRYRPRLVVRFPEGAPRGVPIAVTAKMDGANAFEVSAGGVPVTATGVSDLVVALPALDPWSGDATVEATASGRTVTIPFSSRPLAEQALARAERALAKARGDESWLVPGSLDSMRYLSRRLGKLVARGDADVEAQAEEARELDRLAAALERNVDPYDGRTGPMRRAIRSPLDGDFTELGLYVPPSYKTGATRKYPLVVGLHGLNSNGMSMMRAVFGFDDPKREPSWKDRHPAPLPAFDAFVVTPHARGNTMYREIGEDDVLDVVRWATKTFPIDPARVTITGPSMGGIGSAAIPLHAPHVYAASAPLCGYHSLLIRSDIANVVKRPWERFLLEERSNVFWAENGEHLPLWIVHGTKDLPETNSYVLIDRYEQLKYSVKHDHPDAGHNVWGPTYEDLKGLKWLVSQKLDLHPTHVRFKTPRTRYGTSAWVAIDELAAESGWGEVDARVSSKTKITMTTQRVSAVTLARDEQLLDPTGATTVVVDRQTLVFEPDEPLSMKRSLPGSWEKGAPASTGAAKRGKITGPLRDVFHEPIVFVYGAGDEDARVNELVARAFAKRSGVHVDYPVMSDAEFSAKKEPLANDRALFLVGRTNKIVAAVEAAAASAGMPFPIHVDSGAVTLGAERMTGRELGAAFIRPNPARPDRYVVIMAGADVPGTLRALAVPDLVPDFVVWDEGVTRARGQMILAGGSLRAAGFFRKDWSLPSVVADPLALKAPRETASNLQKREETPKRETKTQNKSENKTDDATPSP